MNEAALLLELKKNPFLLAPMAGITDLVFREFMRKQGAGIVISELISANGLLYNSEKTRQMMRFSEEERPVGIQIFGERTDALVNAAQYIEQIGADFVDLNLGCPVKKVVTKGAGSALLREPLKLKEMLRAIKKEINIPLTIKIRTGWDQNQRNADEIIQVAYDEGVTWVAIHGRTRSQGYNGLADWEYIKEVKQKSPLPIIGNGDITTPQKAVDRLNESGCDGVMIGRGSLKNPWIFSQAQKLWKENHPETLSREYLPLFLYLREKSEENFDERTTTLVLRKLSSWYSAGLPGAAEFRRSIFTARGLDETWSSIENFYSPIRPEMLSDTSHDAFLMGGHG